ncbi:head GIN domain-containing protein [Blastococcus atacamensis]|uniref:head GIN domain-containing protein n=1 Tax=Blastococcus atacamensis TaxID=2070508 RepID=UPI001300114E|nr:head GIN domain-containing protein [Blastococcus atacamensis]
MLIRCTTVVAAATLAVLSTTGCSLVTDTGPVTTQDRAVAGVTGVRLETSGTLSITPGASPALTVTAGSKVIARLTSEVDGEVLVLAFDGRALTLGDVHYSLTLPRLNSLVVTGSGQTVAESVPADALSVTVDGSGDVEMRGLDVAELHVALTGSGTVEAEGDATTQQVRVEGSGDYAADLLDSAVATVIVAGSGSADVRATDTLTATVRGSGDISHTGGPRVTSTVDGSGEVVAR